MIHVVGGTYREKCLDHFWNMLFGSGGRAAGALTSFQDKVSLTTYIGEEDRHELKFIANSLRFDVFPQIIPQTITFEYDHCLSNPTIYPNSASLEQLPPLTVNDENIIRYGFIEGDSIVHGENVVYDPQNEYTSHSFRSNGSTAEKLAIIANINECQKLTNSSTDLTDAEILGKRLLKMEEAEVVVVKQGSAGALVVTPSRIQFVPAYQTKRVFSIGSGDIFTAAFAHFWISNITDPFQSAKLASLATSYYCNTRILPIPLNFEEFAKYKPVINRNDFPNKTKQIYLAGPFFTLAEKWLIEEARKHLISAGFKVFSPMHDVGIGPADEVAQPDIEGLKESDLVFAILTGLDSGTLFEVGYARALNKPVIALSENVFARNMTMIEGTDCKIVGDFTSAIYMASWTAMEM